MTDIGHNSDGAALQGFVDRINKLSDEKANLVEDLRSVYAEAKEKDIDVKALRAVIKRMREDAAKRAEREAAIDAMLSKLGILN